MAKEKTKKKNLKVKKIIYPTTVAEKYLIEGSALHFF